ncbi:MAG: hypothetical protein LBP32_09110 [Spirochaetaceae bacterium]|jgi:hypothetical protein|nr:hypothetical protein [Spirochaetaceae bacterium]
MRQKKIIIGLLWLFPAFTGAEPLVSPTWGFRIDPPEGYQYIDGDGRDHFSFLSASGAALDLAVYAGGTHASVETLAEDTRKRLGIRGEISFFEYRRKGAALFDVDMAGRAEGWALCVELEAPRGEPAPLLLALAYGPPGREDLRVFHLSALDSIAPTEADRRVPGPVTEFTYPRGNLEPKPLAGLAVSALVGEFDPEGAQALVDREFAVLRRYIDSPLWREAWSRYYRAVYRDSFDRLAGAAFALERTWNVPADQEENRGLAEKALAWVQSFAYERNFLGSDFVNPVSAALEGRGDCDSRALLWAIILKQANIPAAIMVSQEFGHAMGLADIPGIGARFEWAGKRWLTAETTAPVALGRIAADMSETSKWLGVVLE